MGQSTKEGVGVNNNNKAQEHACAFEQCVFLCILFLLYCFYFHRKCPGRP